MKKRICLLLFIITTLTFKLAAQYYTSGEDPASVKWNQINTPHFRLIFPQTFQQQAQRFASILETSYPFVSYSMNYHPKPITILIHSKSAYSNGFVTWAPRRMEIYPTPHQGIYAQDWLEQLGIHESRHVVQIGSLNRGFTRFLSFLYGQQATGAIAGSYIPMWFFEGDATLTETLLSESGRGRQPSFEMELKAQLLDRGAYSYNKAYLGSYASYVPNYYVMGYHLVAGARQQYGRKLWENTLKGCGANSWWPFIFSHELKKQTGLPKRLLYKSIFDSLQISWRKQDSMQQIKACEAITPIDKQFKSYRYPHHLQNGNIIAEVSGPGEVNRFIEILPTGKEETVYIPGSRNEEPFSTINNKLIWSELQSNIRWEQAKSSIIRIMDLQTHKVRTLIKGKTRLFAPALSPNGERVALVRLDENNQCLLDIVDSESGKSISSFSVGNDYLFAPSWSNDGQTLVMVKLTKGGKQLVTLNSATGQWQAVTAPSYSEIEHPVISNNVITYSDSKSGKQNIYQINTLTNITHQITAERFGAYDPNIFQNQLYYSRYTADGYQLAKGDTLSVPSQWGEMVSNAPSLYKGLEREEQGKPNFDTTTFTKHDVKPYSKWHLLNFHSWAPNYINVNEGTITNGVTVMSQNLLNTMVVQAGYNADPNFRYEKWNASISYKGWFPVLELTLKAGDTKEQENVIFRNETDAFELKYNITRNHYQINPGISLPFNLSRGAWSRYISPSVKYTYYKANGYNYTLTNGYILNNTFIAYPNGLKSVRYPNYIYQGMEYDLFAYNLRRGTERDVTNRLGQVIELNYRQTPWGSIDRGTQLALFTKLYFPGLMKYHSLKIENNMQWRTDGDSISTTNSLINAHHFSSIVTLPRGYGSSGAKQIYSFKGDYSFPLANPDFSLGGILYLKRITSTLFYDFSSANYQYRYAGKNSYFRYRKNYQSFGTEMMAEMHVARFLLPIGIGGRFAWLPNEKQSYTELLISLNLSGYLPNRAARH